MSDLLSPLQKRDVLYGVKKTSAEDLRRLAGKFESEGWWSDAADFLAQAKDLEGLKSLRQKASEEGDTFLLLKTSRQLGDVEPPTELLRACAEKAGSLGKNRFALKAYEKLGLAGQVEKIRGLIANDGDIRAESESTVFIPASEEEITENEQDQEDSD